VTDRETLLSTVARMAGYSSYLELGLYDGTNLCGVQTGSGCLSRCVGVDIQLRIPERPGIKLFQMTTDVFFEQNTERFDMVFIDADHNYESTKKDLANSLKILIKGGAIFMHDTDPMNEGLLDPGECGDSYRLIREHLVNQPHLSHITLPLEGAGMTVITRTNDRRVLDFT